MKAALKFLIALALALLLVWVIRAYAFTVFSVPTGGLAPTLEEGDRVIVNRISCDHFERGDMVVFANSASYKVNQGFWEELLPSQGKVFFIGQIEKLPGDTIRIGTARYAIPMICCKRCGCPDCHYYLVRTSQGLQLVHKHQLMGKAYKLF